MIKRIVLISTVLLACQLTGAEASDYPEKTEKNVGIQLKLNDRVDNIHWQPVMINDRLYISLSDVKNLLGYSVKRDNSGLMVANRFHRFLLGEHLNQLTDEVGNAYTIEQPVKELEGNTYIPLRAFSDILGYKVDWNDAEKAVSIRQKKNKKEGMEGNLLVGSSYGPLEKEASQFVENNKLLKEITNIKKALLRFEEYGSSATMVTGKDGSGETKFLWLETDTRTGDISVIGTALAKSGISRDKAIDILQAKGIHEDSIKNAHLVPYQEGILWLISATRGGQNYYYGIDFYTGEISIENIVPLND
ncbi:hypothetical protein GTO91_11505 [Heliobacterium undosum]|uniref:Copper amine oxidase-like N-terminal domain-containing protein n=1 Tax=Heliomicrobium undosum TaxID=121734 RepID=A0A845L1F4_9FIRM|nr:stalk domain-containing protein [Heliomicrobium undosum]MZP30337.1 hypothetical protein [Heliomicrobium undosum]